MAENNAAICSEVERLLDASTGEISANYASATAGREYTVDGLGGGASKRPESLHNCRLSVEMFLISCEIVF